ncbi:MAG: hypothetical protein HND40_11480 [Ignavibacteriota bacterium]|nr:hypothetical protein [Ignavibacteriota bacterium]MBW7869367.1 hypothetical protein [Brumimicrobium sp.]MCO6446485.1 hypothetical protein [Ignavibacterium album]MCZ2267926.1 hypothetical protein [Ignavibacteriales bacterium]MEB2297554.1 hypothetical protein [Ignavibacteria bacterium]HOJ06414.1 hypothetical protein [Ignavibacteriaceae bacterium]
MKKTANIITAIAAIIFSALSIVEGSRVLLGISVPEYVVFTPLLIYNIIMGITGVYAGVQIFRQHISSLRNSAVISLFHISILITISLLYFFDSVVSIHSVYAMIFRTVLWLIITITIWASNKYLQTKREE